MAQYNGLAIIPLERICTDYVSQLTPQKDEVQIAAGQIDLTLVPMESSQKAARGVHLPDLTAYLDAQNSQAKAEHDKLLGLKVRRAR